MPGVITTPPFFICSLYPGAEKRLVQLMPSTSFPQGTVLGEVFSKPGTYGPYDQEAKDGRQYARLILEADCATDENGNITLASLVFGQGSMAQQLRYSTYAFVSGCFAIRDLVGLDANAVSQLGRLVEGTIAAGGTLLVP